MACRIIHGPFALARGIKNLTKLQMAPDFRPAADRRRRSRTHDTRCSGLVPLQIKYFRNAVVGERTVLVDFQRLVELAQCAARSALRIRPCPRAEWNERILMSFELVSTRLSGSTRNTARASEGLNRKRRIRANHFDALLLRLSVGIALKFHRHAEQIEILIDLADHPESLCSPGDTPCTWS